MKLHPSVFECDTQAVTARVEAHIREHAQRMGRRGVALGISGGVDSSVVATLCARAVGPGRVHGLILTEREGNPEAVTYARRIAAHLGIRVSELDITPALKKLGVYRFITSLVPSRRIAGALVRRYMQAYDGNPYLDHKKGGDRPLIHRGFAMINAKHRMRLVYAYRYVEQRNLMLAGCAHRSETELGLFVKFGIDDCADLMPLAPMYRSHVLRLARFLGVPEEITGRSPSPDVVPGICDKYADVLGVSSPAVDLVLVGLASAMSTPDIAEAAGISAEEVASIAELRDRTYHMRQPALAPDIPDAELWAGRAAKESE